MSLPKEDRTEIPYLVPITYRDLKPNYKSFTRPMLSERAIALGRMFQRISTGGMQPNGVGGVLKDGENVMAFRGVGDADMAMGYHFLVIPKNMPHLESIHDLDGNNAEHHRVVDNMATFGYGICVENNLTDQPICMGFHNDPTVGYLHMHVLVGHLTECGYRERHRWVSVKNVFNDNPNPYQQLGIDVSRLLGG